MLIGLVLPPAAPHEVERARESEQVLRGGGRNEMQDAVDVQPAPGWTPVRGEPEQRDHAVDVDEQQWSVEHVTGIRHKKRLGRGQIGHPLVYVVPRLGSKRGPEGPMTG